MNSMKELLKEKRITQQNIADLLKISQPAAKYKIDTENFKLDEIRKISKYWGFTDEQIIFMVTTERTRTNDLRDIKRMVSDIRKAVVEGNYV